VREVQEPPELRPLSVGEILDVAIKILRRNAKALFLIVLVVLVPVQILVGVVQYVALPSQDALNLAPGETPDFAEIGGFIAAAFVLALLSGLAWLIASGACFKVVRDAYLGGRPSVGAGLRASWRRLPAIVAVALVLGVGLTAIAVIVFSIAAAATAAAFALNPVLGVLVLLVTVGGSIAGFLFFLVRWSVALPALLAERGLGPLAALARSWRLVAGRFWPTCAAVVLAFLLTSVVQALVAPVTFLFPIADGANEAVDVALNTLVSTLASVITTPFLAAVLAVLYFDLRVRKEGLDLELLTRALGGGTAPPPQSQPDEPRPA